MFCANAKPHWPVHGECNGINGLLKRLFYLGDAYIDGESGVLLSIVNLYVVGAISKLSR